MRDLRNSTVVITGASSGIGRAAALAFAREGANLALIARRSNALQELAAECAAKGVRAIALPVDVTDADAVRRAAETASRRSGRIDVWINNAGVGAVGRFTDTPVEAHDQVVLTNLIGYIHGAHAVLPYFQRQPTGASSSTRSPSAAGCPRPSPRLMPRANSGCGGSPTVCAPNWETIR